MSKRKWYTRALYTIVALAMTVGLLMVPAAVAALETEVWVDDDFTAATPGWNTTHFDTIQKGIDGAAADGTVNVAAGTYTEDPVIDKSLTLSGPNAAISPNTGTRVAEAIIAGRITFSGVNDDVTIQGFNFEVTPSLASISTPGGSSVGALHILKNSFTADPATGDPVAAIENVPTLATIAGWVIDDNLFTGVRGIQIDNSEVSDVTITNNVIDGDPSTPAMAGISVDGVSGTISGNTISYTWDAGINVSTFYNVCDGLTISGNTVTHAGCAEWGNAGAINMYSDCTNITIQYNTLADSYDGITVKDAGGVAVAASVIAHCNNIYGNSNYGVYNNAPGTFSAAKNWWGHASGPTHFANPGGAGDKASDRVFYVYWSKGLIDIEATITGDLYLVPDYLYTTGLDDWEEIDIAYNVKTAEETFTVVDAAGNPVPGVLVSDWSVIKGCGEGDVEIVAGGEDGDNFITVWMVVKGDCHISAWIDMDCDCERDEKVTAEKKWGEIYCTELVKDPLDQYHVIETVKASFLWDDCVTEVQLLVDDALVDWWLMDIDAQPAVEALEAALGVDLCDEDGGCGTYTDDFFWYDYDADGVKDAIEVFDSPREALVQIQLWYPDITASVIDESTEVDQKHHQNFTGVDGKAWVNVTLVSPASVMLVTLADYPEDKHGQNTVCVQHEKWIIVPPPVHEKLPNILWAGEKDVIEWRLEDFDDTHQAVVFYLEDPSVGTFEALVDPYFADPLFPGFAIKDTAWGLVEENPCDGSYVARTVLHSDKQGKANVIAVLMEWSEIVDLAQSGPKQVMWDEYEFEIVAQQGFLIYFLAFEEVELVNLPDDVDNDEAWEEAGETLSDLALDDESLLRFRVKGFFEDPVMTSPRPEKPQDLDGDGTTDIILPAGRWVLPDDYPTIALGKLLWDIMDTPIDDIVSWLDEDGDQIETLGGQLGDVTTLGRGFGGYGDGACFEMLVDDTPTAADWVAYWADAVNVGPVIGPFSKLEPVNDDGTGWDITQQPAVPADGNEIDDFTVALFSGGCRTTVVPDGSITPEDANMPPAEILFVLTDGAGNLADVNKADLYYRDADCVRDTDSVDGEVYTNPYYWQEIPANIIIPPQYGSGLAGYEWDSWGREAEPAIDGPYRFWDELDVWTSDELIAMNILDLTAVPPIVKVYTDNHGEAWVEFEQKSFISSTIQAIATYPYLIGDHLPLVSNPVTKLSEDLKDVKVAWEAIDDMYDMLYVFVRDYDGDPGVCEPVDWNIDGIAGTIVSLLTDTAGPCDNACLDITCEGSIAEGSRSAQSCTREMTSTEITEFTGATISVPLDRFHRELGEPGALLFDPTADELPEDYAIAGIKVSSSLGDPVDIMIKIHDCWADVEVVIEEDQILYFGVIPPDEVEWSLAYGQDADPAAVNIWVYPAGAATVTLLDVDATMPDGLLIWHYGGPIDGWKFYKKGWGASNTLTTMVPGGYIGIVPTASTWEIPQS